MVSICYGDAKKVLVSECLYCLWTCPWGIDFRDLDLGALTVGFDKVFFSRPWSWLRWIDGVDDGGVLPAKSNDFGLVTSTFPELPYALNGCRSVVKFELLCGESCRLGTSTDVPRVETAPICEGCGEFHRLVEGMSGGLGMLEANSERSCSNEVSKSPDGLISPEAEIMY